MKSIRTFKAKLLYKIMEGIQLATINELNKQERPREKAKREGIRSLSNCELLAILLRCGYKGTSVLQMSETILHELGGLSSLSTITYEELIQLKGISSSKALELLASIELSKRISYATFNQTIQIDSPKVLSAYLNNKIGFYKQEHFYVLFLNIKNQIIYEKTIFIGTLTSSVVHPREIFSIALIRSAASIILAHNHPSKACEPSEQDILVTNNLVNVGDIMGIQVLDHLIVSHNAYFSFREHQLINY